MIASLPERPAPARVTALVPVAEQIEMREPGALRAMFAATGRVVSSAASSAHCNDASCSRPCCRG